MSRGAPPRKHNIIARVETENEEVVPRRDEEVEATSSLHGEELMPPLKIGFYR